jgi:23S rRNA pseudouridine1911/1915/1917 synthase
VHLADLGYPLVGDKIYGRRQPKSRAGHRNSTNLDSFPRQALHAERLGIFHPRSGKAMDFYAPLPEDMAALVESLESESDYDYRVSKIEINQTKRG